MQKEKVFILKGKVQHYAWGGASFIPKLLNISNKEDQPFAEYWMGAHPSASSVIVIENKEVSLNELIQQKPETYIGQKVNEKFGELPYLFKILDVKQMLSIQVHPSKLEAEKGFDAEEAAGMLISDKTRNYKDRNHKPEVMVALSEFWLLHGFQTKDKLSKVLQSIPEFITLCDIFDQQGYKGLYQYVMELKPAQVDQLLAPLVQRELRLKTTDKAQPGFWVCRLYEDQLNAELSGIDPGIFSIYFFNIVKALPGEAIFQGAGVPHAYLEGQNVELMANSDNVLRAGLTPKHIDVPELLKHTTFEGIIPDIMKGTLLANKENNYPCPIDDFGISKLALSEADVIKSVSGSGEILLVLEGDISIETDVNMLHLFEGEAAYILPDTVYTISSNESGTAFKAFVPKIN